MRRYASSIIFASLLVLCAGVARAQVFDLQSYLDAASGGSETSGVVSSRVDLLYDSSTYAPPFFKGRPLPSPGSTMRFQAIPHFVDASGHALDSADVVYTWRVDGTVEGSISGLGRSSVVLPSPGLFGSNTVSVEARAQSGSGYGTASMTISSIDPDITLYQDHPVFGIEYYSAVGSEATIADNEMTFAAVPYFIGFQSGNDPRLDYEWTVNGSPVAATSTNNNEITVSAGNSGGFAAITLSLTSRSNILLSSRGAWNVTFSRSSLSNPL